MRKKEILLILFIVLFLNLVASQIHTIQIIGVQNNLELSNPNLVAHYKFEDNFEDSSENEIHGTNEGAEFANWEHGKGAMFNGTTSIDFGNSSLLQLVEDVSFSFWACPNNISRNTQLIIEKGIVSEYGIALQPYAGGALMFAQSRNPSLRFLAFSRIWHNIFKENECVHIVLVRNSLEQTVTLYKNNISLGNGLETNYKDWITPSPSFGSVKIGNLPPFRNRPSRFGFQGILDEFKIWNSTLTREEVEEEYCRLGC
jgi:hypothetical protein